MVASFAPQFDFEEVLGIRNYSPAAASFVSPAFGASAAAATYFSTSGPRVAALAGSIGFGAVAATYTAYSLLGMPDLAADTERVIEVNFGTPPRPQPDNQVEILELEVADAAQPPNPDDPEG